VSVAKPKTAETISSADYIRANFRPSERIAVLLRNAGRRETLQRISTAERISANPFQAWLRYQNSKEGFDIYVGMNALKSTAFRRTKDDILAIRHLYVDLDHHGTASLAKIEESTLVPPPNYVLNTSPDKFQVIWRVDDMELPQAEALLHALAREFDADKAATDAARVLRLPGFLNKKYQQDFLVSARLQTDRLYHSRDFRLPEQPSEPDRSSLASAPRSAAASGTRATSQSERDWAYVKNALAHGVDPEELIRQLTHSRAGDKSDPQYYARLTVRKAVDDLRTQSAGIPESSNADKHLQRNSI
jgi:RepB DNA-primase from phage plasmid